MPPATNPRNTTVSVVGCVLLCVGSIALGAEGLGSVYVPNAIDDPAVYAVVLTDLDGTGFLRGLAADVTNARTVRAASGDLDFRYDPNGSLEERIHFAETMAYYHVTSFRHYVQSLGFDGIDPVSVIVYNAEKFGSMWIPIIPSAYDSTTHTVSLAASMRLVSSDAVDGDMIVHEYVHALQHQLRGGNVTGWETATGTTPAEQSGALMEAVSDYLATSRFDDPEWGEWSAGMWCYTPFMRNVNNFRRSDGVYSDGMYQASLIFSGALWDLRSVVGAEVVDTLALRMVEQIPDTNPTSPELNATFTDAVATILSADAELYGGAHADQIRQAFAVRKLAEYEFETALPMVRDPGNDYDGTHAFTLNGAPVLAVTFDEFVTKLDDAWFNMDTPDLMEFVEKDTVDFLEILDAEGSVAGVYTGRQLQGKTIVVPGDTVQLHLVTDAWLAPFGYRVTDISSVLVGDANLDGVVGIADLTCLADRYGLAAGAAWQDGDFNFDGAVGIADLAALADHYGETSGNTIPEPAGLSLLAAGVLWTTRRRRIPEARLR